MRIAVKLFCGIILVGAAAWLAWPEPCKGGEPTTPVPAPIAYGRPRKLCDLANRRIRESSGLACSRLADRVFWTHNDSGDRPRVYAFNRKGEHLAVVELAGARAGDWEDMASYTSGGKAYLLLADVGDNKARRARVTLYIIREPRLPASGKPRAGRARLSAKIDVVYEDGPHDCEAVAVDPTRKTIYLVSKKILGAGVYELALPKASPAKPLTARIIATLPVPIVTAMDISPDGRRAILLTYGSAYEFTRRRDEKWADAFQRDPRRIAMPPRRQGESICYGRDGKTIYLTSEKVPTPLLEVPVKDGSARPTTGPATKPR